MSANVNDTIKTANDMTAKGMDQFNNLAELNMRAWEKLTSRQMDNFRLCLEQGLRMMKAATDAKDYNDYVKGQAEIVKEVTERMLAETKTNMQVAGEIRDNYRTWYEQSLADLTTDLGDSSAKGA